ncbi:MAG: glycosyltransferase family 9 protein [Ignavibacteriales bacterium]|nr:glycosyltransferase family 9 protein [Ignavibacteriales bacterium]
MKILVIALSGIGDALMFTPALKLLKKSSPDSSIDALVMFGAVKEIYDKNPFIDSVLHFNFLRENIFVSLKFVLHLRKKYDSIISIYPSNRKEYNLISFLIGAKKRAAVEYLRDNKMNLGWLNNITVKEDDSVHNVQTNIKLIEKLLNKNFDDEPPMEIYLSNEEEEFAEKYLNELNINKSDLVIGFHPGCATLKNHIKRRWEAEKFAALAGKLITKKYAKIFLFGGPEEEELKSLINSMIDSENSLIIKTETFLQSIAVMKRCNLFITNDSALMHVASALKLKVVAIIGPTNTNYIHPWKTEYRIASLNLECSPCFFYSPKPLSCSRTDIKFKCIKELEVDLVYAKAEELLEQ